jgi:hypothetical protein
VLVSGGVGIAVANSGAFRTSPEGVVVRSFGSELAQTQTALVLRKGRHSSTLEAVINRIVAMVKVRGRSRLPLPLQLKRNELAGPLSKEHS